MPWCTAQANHDLERSILRAGCIYPRSQTRTFLLSTATAAFASSSVTE